MQHEVAGTEAYLHTKWHLDAPSRSVAKEMSQKLGAPLPFLGEESWVPI